MLPYGIEWVTTLHGDIAGSFRLRLSDYRVLFTLEENTMWIFGVATARKPTAETVSGCCSALRFPIPLQAGVEVG